MLYGGSGGVVFNLGLDGCEASEVLGKHLEALILLFFKNRFSDLL